MSAHTSRGYVQMIKKPEDVRDICLTFNGNIHSTGSKGVRLDGFTLRLSTSGPINEGSAEIGITLTVEQWLDLVADMKREFEKFQHLRKQMDDFRESED